MVDFVDEKERELFARTQLGLAAVDFLDTDLGRYLHGRAQKEIEQAQVDSLDCNTRTWWGRRKHANLQNKALIARNFLKWIVEAIQDGEVAHQELSEYRKEET
jgi:hypothetical protein